MKTSAVVEVVINRLLKNNRSVKLESFLKTTYPHMKLLALCLTLIVSMAAFAQDTSSVVVHKDPRIDLLIKKQAEINEEASKRAKTGKGFRLLIINTNKREEAINAKAMVYKYFPELKSYLYYQSPYFKLKAGNFKEKKDAEAYQKKLNKYFPKGVFIMPDAIELKDGKGNKINEEPNP